MVDRRSISLPEFGPTEFPANEPCFFLFPPIYGWIKILCNNRQPQPQPRLLILAQPHYNRNRDF